MFSPKHINLPILILFFIGGFCFGQVKIGDDVSTIHNGSILELESTSKVLVLTRVTNAQMSTLNPLPGGMVFNTDTGCIHSYNGSSWRSLCNASSGAFSFTDNNNGTFTINYSDGTSFTSSDLTGPQGETGEQGNVGPQGPPGADGLTGIRQEQIVIIASTGQTQFATPATIDDEKKIEVYRNGIRIDFTAINTTTIQLQSDIICYQNDNIRIVQIF